MFFKGGKTVSKLPQFPKRFNMLVLILAVVVSAALTFHITMLYASARYQQLLGTGEEQSSSFFTQLQQIRQLYQTVYVGDQPDFSKMEEYAVDGYVAGTGDKYAVYFTADELRDYSQSLAGKLVGVGINVYWDEDAQNILIFHVIPNSPAEQAGLKKGDRIAGVEGTSVGDLGYNTAVDHILGEEGTDVTLSILQADTQQTKDYTMTRSAVEIDSVQSRDLGNGLWLIRVTDFNTNTSAQFSSALEQAQQAGCKGLVFDLRNNPGGALEAIVACLDDLIDQGTLVSMAGVSGETDRYEATAGGIDLPMAVLCNKSTASAAELFCAALQDDGLADIIGEQTFGKGTVITLYSLDGDAGIFISDQYYYTPSGRCIEGEGVTPDYPVSLSEEQEKNLYFLEDSQDPQLQQGINCVKARIAAQ